MAKLISSIDILTDTWQTVITRVNSLIDSLSTEVITANSSTAETGTVLSPRNARLFGQFWANTIATNANTFVVNNTTMAIGNQFKILANNSIGTASFVLTSGGSTGNIYWSSVGSGTVTSVTGGSGLTGGIITSTGTLAVKAGTGIVVNANGVSIDSNVVGSVQSVANGVGLTGGTITSTGTLAVKAGTGIIVNANGVSVTSPTLRNVTSGYTSGGQVFVQSTQPTAGAQGDIWIQI